MHGNYIENIVGVVGGYTASTGDLDLREVLIIN